MLCSHKTFNAACGIGAIGVLTIGALLAFHWSGCSSTQTTSASTPGKGYDSADAAVDSLVAALRSNDQKQLHSILGEGSDDLLNSGDEVADANARADFLKMYDEKHRLEKHDDGSMTLDVGATDWPR